ncbi:MAG: hypothetical protein WAT19_01485 [Ferruginibacter sp.]
MSLDDIQLVPSLAAGLYKKTLVDVDNRQTKMEPPQNELFAILGSNRQGICILVNEVEFPFLSDEDMQFLTGILAACKLSMADVALLNTASTKPLNYQLLNDELKPSVILFFGTDPAATGFPLQFPNYQLQKYNNQTFLSAPGLKILSENKEEKKKLWLCLKTLFNV